MKKKKKKKEKKKRRAHFIVEKERARMVIIAGIVEFKREKESLSPFYFGMEAYLLELWGTGWHTTTRARCNCSDGHFFFPREKLFVFFVEMI